MPYALGAVNLIFCVLSTSSPPEEATLDTIVVVNSCGDAYKDRAIIERRLGKKYV